MRTVICPIAAVDRFIQVAYEQTTNLNEMCAILAGRVQEDGTLLITAVIVPKQSGSQDQCAIEDELGPNTRKHLYESMRRHFMRSIPPRGVLKL